MVLNVVATTCFRKCYFAIHHFVSSNKGNYLLNFRTDFPMVETEIRYLFVDREAL